MPESLPNDFHLPHRLRRLADLAYNLWWTWQPEAPLVFEQIDPSLWEDTYHNPVRFLRQVDPERVQRVIQDRPFLAFYDDLINRFDEYLQAESTWTGQTLNGSSAELTAYLSTEFGLHETLPIYAGGLGVLSGDHLKEASDLGLPLVAVGFLYTQGYFSQRITEDGWQEADYLNLSFPDLPVLPVMNGDGGRLTIGVGIQERQILAQLWRIQVGRVPLFLLDTNLEANAASDRNLTARLYTSDLELRLAQEVILGIGGVRALRALDLEPATWHMNEGHSAFLLLELMRERIQAGETLEAAAAAVQASTVFTTHTPVPAGHDEFPLTLMDKYFFQYWPQLGLERDAFMDLARHQQPWGDVFSMAILGLTHAGQRNGVSAIHGRIARQMWSPLWPDRAPEEVPISHITNGVHTGTWLARSMMRLFDHYLPADWRQQLDDPGIWQAIERIPDEELWQTRRHLKRKLTGYARHRIRARWGRGQAHPVQVVASGALLDPDALTIGFARRFATYKRADLILSDIDRLLGLLNDPDRPLQIIFAGKAHPADEPGKRLIQDVYRQVKRAENGGRLVFLEDYDMNLARYLLHGVDIWLNTPRQPNEASGTSGQKAALNGVLNFSVLDGWWAEGYNGRNGWAIGQAEPLEDSQAQDEADAASLYRLLEEEIIPMYYDRSADELPGEWIGRVKESIRTLAPAFSMRRAVKQYALELYYPLAERVQA